MKYSMKCADPELVRNYEYHRHPTAAKNKECKKPVDGSKKMVWGLDELKMFGNGLLIDDKAYRAKMRFLDAKQRLQNM